MKEMHQHNNSKLPRKLFVDKKYIILETEKAKKFNEFFTEIGPTLARKTPAPGKPCESFLKKPERCLMISRLKDTFFSLKMNKSTSADEISSNVIKICFEEISDISKVCF